MKVTLKKFIVNRVLSDPATLMRYTKGKCKIPSGKFEKKYREETKRHALYRLFVLIIFLDRAKLANVVERVPNLFAKGASVKSSREVIVALCRDFLSAEGDIIKHLSRIGLKVSYKQEHVDEIDFTITNLAVDLRDGVRLARMVEVLKEETPKTLLNMLRLPAVSRLQKLHNVSVVLENLRDSGVPNTMDIGAHHVVDGHREVVLKLLWSVAAYFKLESLLNADRLKNEIQSVRQANRFRRKYTAGTHVVDTMTEKSDSSNDLKVLLLRWCTTVCSCFGLLVTNFTTDFADGKALCFLLHYYHPGLLKRKEILPTTRDIREGCGEELNRVARQREQQNSALANARMSELGGIPRMLPITDTDNVPEEKSVLLCVAYLCSRLMDSSKEILATIAIQNCYRRYLGIIRYRKKLLAGFVVLKMWRKYKEQYYAAQRRKFLGPVRVIESFFFGFKDRIRALRMLRQSHEQQLEAATVIQVRVEPISCRVHGLWGSASLPHFLYFFCSRFSNVFRNMRVGG